MLGDHVMTNEPVRFNVELNPSIDGNSVKKDLEQLATDLHVDVLGLRSLGRQLVTGSTSQETYEEVFGAKLEYVTKTIPHLNKGPYDVQEWQEIRPATVPETLRDRVAYIRLEQKFYLTD